MEDDFSNFSLLFNITGALLNATSDSFVFTKINTFDGIPSLKHEQILSYILFFSIISLAFIGLIKTIILLVSYIITNIIWNIVDLIYTIFASKFSVNIFYKLKKMFRLTSSEIKKLYTFNFYSYKNPLQGLCLVILYFMFLAYNLIFTLTGISSDYGQSILSNCILTFCFCINVFFEIYIPFFYYTRKQDKMKTYLIFSCSMIYGAFLVLSFAIYIDTEYKSITYSNIFALVFYVYLMFINALTLKKIYFYSTTQKAIKTYLTQIKIEEQNKIAKYVKFNTQQLNVLDQIYLVKDVYISDDNFPDSINFAYRDKYHFKKALLFFFFINEIGKLLLCVVLFLPLRAFFIEDEEQRDTFLYEIDIFQKSLLVGNTIIINILVWMTFMKPGIKTYYLY